MSEQSSGEDPQTDEDSVEYPDSVAGDIFELHEKHPDFDHREMWWIRYWPIGVLLFGTMAALSLPFAVVAKGLLKVTNNRHVRVVSVAPRVFGGLCIATIIGNLLGQFNEAMPDLEEEEAQKDA